MKLSERTDGRHRENTAEPRREKERVDYGARLIRARARGGGFFANCS